MAISPKMSVYINILVALLAAIVSGTVSFSGLVPDPISHEIVRWAAFILSIFSVINAALHSVSSSLDGPLTNVRIKIEKVLPKEVGVILMIFGLFSVIGIVAGNAPPTQAAIKHGHKPLAKTPLKHEDRAPIGIIQDTPFEPYAFINAVELTPADAQPSLLAPQPMEAEPLLPVVSEVQAPQAWPLRASPKLNGALANIWKDLQSITLQDLQYANNLALANQDTISSTCYSALITLIQKSQAANIDPATGLPLTLPSVHLVTDLENIIIIYRELQPTSATSVACAPLMNAVKVGSISALLTGFGTGGLVSGLILP